MLLLPPPPPFYGPFFGTTQVSQYLKKQSSTYTYPDHQSFFICFLHLLWSMASSLFNLRAWQSVCTISLQVFFGLLLGLATSTSYTMHFYTQLLCSFRSTCPYHRNLFCCACNLAQISGVLCHFLSFCHHIAADNVAAPTELVDMFGHFGQFLSLLLYFARSVCTLHVSNISVVDGF